jgi:hypothetical protein
MKKAKFKPVWDAFQLSPVVETSGVNIALPFAIRATVMLDPGESLIELAPEDLAAMTSVYKDGIRQVSFGLDGNIIYVPATPDETAVVEIERSGDVDFSVFAGEIVPGIHVSKGRIKGIVGNIPYTEPHTYRFGLRGQWNGQTADVVTSWVATPMDNQLTWNTDTLPIAEVNSLLINSRFFYSIGEFRRGQTVEVAIDIYNPDGTPLEVLTREVPEMVAGEKHFNGSLPLGLAVNNNPLVIKGFIPAEAVSGDYFVELYVDEPFGPTPIIIHAKVLGDSFDKGTAINRLTWETAEDLGTVREGLPCTFKVEATNSAGGNVIYTLAAGSRPLPVGVILAPSGEIRGIAPHFGADTEIDVTIKAMSGPYVSQKHFRFKVLRTFEKDRHLTVSLPLTGYDRRAWQGYAGQIDSTRRFRPDDTNFGSASPTLLLIRGLTARPISGLTYDEPFDLIVGPFKYAEVIQDGVHLYDVIYREFFDPMNKAGGFVPDDHEIIESPVFYPENPSIRITEGTIRNLRSDLVLKVGLDSPDATKHRLGLDGGELLDPWMSSVQKDGSKIGYISAGVIDYVQAGMGRVVRDSLTYGDIPVGTVIRFDRMRVQDSLNSYYYYLGWGRNDSTDIRYDAPLAPHNFRVDGIPAEDDVAMHQEPRFSWAVTQIDSTYRLRIYVAQTLVRTIDDWEDAEFTYTQPMQAEDDNPGHIFVELVAVREGLESPVLDASVRLRTGWGRAWGFRWGGTL